jgi:hypothetical protein
MSVTPLLFEKLVRVAPFGVSFWDVDLGRRVTDGLEVTLIPDGQPFTRVPAFRNTSGVYVAQNLPGLRSFEFGDEGGFESPASPRDVHGFRVEVVDLTGRFHDVSFEAGLPVDSLFEAMCGSPPSPPGGIYDVVPLFSLPSRPVPAGFAAVRSQLVNVDGSPAHLAALEIVAFGGAEPVRGYADVRGEVLTLVPYPEPSGSTGSPPFVPGGKLTDQHWQIEVGASVPGAPPDATLPDICSFALQQPASLTVGGIPLPATQTLDYGRDLILPPRPAAPELVVAPTGSPP